MTLTYQKEIGMHCGAIVPLWGLCTYACMYNIFYQQGFFFLLNGLIDFNQDTPNTKSVTILSVSTLGGACQWI